MLSQINELEQKTGEADFWNDKDEAEKTFQKLNALKDSYYPWQKLIKDIDDISDLIEMYSSEDDEALTAELDEQIIKLDEEYKPLKLKTLLDGKFDKNDMFLSIHAGAGGTEACDWANMLLRMYLRWCERHGFKSEILDILRMKAA